MRLRIFTSTEINSFACGQTNLLPKSNALTVVYRSRPLILSFHGFHKSHEFHNKEKGERHQRSQAAPSNRTNYTTVSHRLCANSSPKHQRHNAMMAPITRSSPRRNPRRAVRCPSPDIYDSGVEDLGLEDYEMAPEGTADQQVVESKLPDFHSFLSHYREGG